MASLYKKPVVRKDSKSGRKITGKSTKWWGRYRDVLGQDKRVPLAKDKAAALAMLNEIVRKVELEKAGRLDPFEAHAKRPIAEHVEAFEVSLKNKDVQDRNIRELTAKVRRLIHDCGFTFVTDLAPEVVQQSLADLRSSGLSIQTSNHYLRAIKQFSRWLTRDRRLASDPLANISMLNVRVDRRHDRRALSSDEFAYLVAAAEAGPRIESIPGKDRAMMYMLAAWTGYRKGEIGSLTKESFQLDAAPPTATIQAGYSKRKRQDKQVLHEALVERLKFWLESKKLRRGQPLFPVSGKVPGGIERKTAKMMKRDLAEARRNWIEESESDEERSHREDSDFLSYCDHEGRYADFHSNRHTFITSLSRNAVSPRMAQSLARHSDIRLTMGTYTHVEVDDQRAAIESLPAPPSLRVSPGNRTPESPKVGAGADSEVPTLVPCGAKNGAKQLAAKKYQASSNCIEEAVERVQKRKKPVDVSSQRALKLRTAKDTSEESQTDCHDAVSEVHPARFELATSGFVNRRSIQLNYGCRTSELSLLAKMREELGGRLARLISGRLVDL